MKPPVRGGFPLLAISFDFSTDLYQFSCRSDEIHKLSIAINCNGG